MTRLFLIVSTLFAAAIVLVPVAAAATEETEPHPELGWPREFAHDDYRLVAYQPQIRSWDDYLRMEADLAVLLTPPGAEPVAGAVKLRAQTDTDMDTRTVFIYDLELVDVRIPEIPGTPREQVEEVVRSTFPDKPIAVSLDRVLAGIARSQVRGRQVELNAAPPTIFVSRRPAVLVNVDGEPAWVPSGVDGLAYAANTNWDLFKYDKKKPKQKTYYLRNYASWLGADDLEGPWDPAGKLPKEFKKLPMNDNFRDVRRNVPGKELPSAAAPTVFYATTPAELVLIDGEPRFAPIPDTPVLMIENTEVDLFRHVDDDHYYFLVAGRWFRNDDLEGPWSAATGDLPEGFADIPEDHPRHHVLASVPGTEQAEEAVLQARIPSVATVDREEAPEQVKVEYVGDPEFREIQGTELAYAVNTSSDVIRAGEKHYLCAQGVWFVSETAEGPWAVADKVPDDIYSIPASSPVHHTTYVYVYDSTPTSVVYGYTPGYVGLYVSWGCVVWGTGWYYSPYYYWDPLHHPYPIYYAYPYTYGAGAWYNPQTGFYGRGHAYYGPYGGVGRFAAYNPATGTYARGGSAYGLGGGTTWGRAYNPRTGVRAAGYRSSDLYSSWGRGVVSRGDQWLKSGHYSDARGSVRGLRDSSGRAAAVVNRGDQRAGVVRGADDLFVGKDGNVYRRGDDGWYKYGDRQGGDRQGGDRQGGDRQGGDRQGGWEKVRDRPAGAQRDAVRDLDRDAADRRRGNVRSDRYSDWRSRGGWSSGARGRSLPRSRGGGLRRR